jgi:uncharacterized membrane protein YagU involved in acid resistance
VTFLFGFLVGFVVGVAAVYVAASIFTVVVDRHRKLRLWQEAGCGSVDPVSDYGIRTTPGIGNRPPFQ